MTIAVILEGGRVQCVVSDDPADFGKEITVIDYDTEDASADELSVVPQDDGSYADAIVHKERVSEALIDLKGIRELTEKEKEAL